MSRIDKSLEMNFVGKYGFISFYSDFLKCINCTCMGRFDASGTSKYDNPLKVLVGHGVKKYGIEIFYNGVQADVWLFVYILWYFKKSINKGIKTLKNNFWA